HADRAYRCHQQARRMTTGHHFAPKTSPHTGFDLRVLRVLSGGEFCHIVRTLIYARNPGEAWRTDPPNTRALFSRNLLETSSKGEAVGIMTACGFGLEAVSAAAAERPPVLR